MNEGAWPVGIHAPPYGLKLARFRAALRRKMVLIICKKQGHIIPEVRAEYRCSATAKGVIVFG